MRAKAPFAHLGLLRNNIALFQSVADKRAASKKANQVRTRIPLYDPPQDVVTVGPAGRFQSKSKNLKALAQYLSHLKRALRPGANETSILSQNHILAHLLKGVHYVACLTMCISLSIYIYPVIHNIYRERGYLC